MDCLEWLFKELLCNFYICMLNRDIVIIFLEFFFIILYILGLISKLYMCCVLRKWLNDF